MGDHTSRAADGFGNTGGCASLGFAAAAVAVVARAARIVESFAPGPVCGPGIAPAQWVLLLSIHQEYHWFGETSRGLSMLPARAACLNTRRNEDSSIFDGKVDVVTEHGTGKQGKINPINNLYVWCSG